MFDWNDLKYFLAVARNGSTSAAAKAMGTSQSTVHRRLRELEAKLGCELIIRHQTGYRLTERGLAMLKHAEAVESAIISFERNLAASNQSVVGTIRVTCPEAFGYRLMRSDFLAKFQHSFPNLRVEFVVTDKLLDLAKGEADVAIRGVVSSDSQLFGRKIADFPWAVYASCSYTERCGAIARFEDINDRSIVEFDGNMRNHSSARWLRSVAPNAHVAVRANSLPSLLLAVKSGIGCAPLPVIVGDGESDLIRMLGTIPGLISTFYLYIHEDMKKAPRVRAFFDFFLKEFNSIRLALVGKPEP